MNSYSLSVVSNDSLVENEKVMTTKELAQVLGVGLTTVKDTVKKLGRVLGSVKKNNQGGYLFTEEQATLIKQEIQKHHNLATRQIDGVTTDYEMELMTQKVLAYHAQKAAEYKARMEVAENALNRIANGKGCYTMGATAKALHINVNGKELGRNNFIDFLKGKHILMENGEPYQNHTEHFKTVIKFINEQVGNKPVTLTTGKGLVYLAKKFNTTIDESVLPDAE